MVWHDWTSGSSKVQPQQVRHEPTLLHTAGIYSSPTTTCEHDVGLPLHIREHQTQLAQHASRRVLWSVEAPLGAVTLPCHIAYSAVKQSRNEK